MLVDCKLFMNNIVYFNHELTKFRGKCQEFYLSHIALVLSFFESKKMRETPCKDGLILN